jgi:hypothetical protein
MRRAFVWVFITALSLTAQDLVPRDVLMLARIRDRVRWALDRLPDCTCIETAARFHRPAGKELKPLDRVVFQILFSGNQELFASPGDTNWRTEPATFIESGMIGNGLFALHLRAIFLNNQSVIKYHGMESSGGREEARYDFSISRMFSGYRVSHLQASGIVGMRGSFWADPETYDLRRLEIHADEIPPELLYTDVSTFIQYGWVHIGTSDVLLPQAADLDTLDVLGEENRDEIEFTHCQGFHTESSVNFGPPDENAAVTVSTPPRVPVGEATLPVGLRVAIALAAALDERQDVGSTVEGRVTDNVALKGKVLIPAGAQVKGRIRRLEHYSDDGGYYIIALEFTHIEVPDHNLRFYADLQDLDRTNGAEMTFSNTNVEGSGVWKSPGKPPSDGPNWSKTHIVRIRTTDVPGVGTFFVRGSHLQLPAGFKTFWKTQTYPRPANR